MLAQVQGPASERQQLSAPNGLEVLRLRKMHEDYGYTQAWVEFLIQKLKDPAEFESLYSTSAPIPETASPLPYAIPRPQVPGVV